MAGAQSNVSTTANISLKNSPMHKDRRASLLVGDKEFSKFRPIQNSLQGSLTKSVNLLNLANPSQNSPS